MLLEEYKATMSSDYELSDNDNDFYSDEDMIDGTQDDLGELYFLLGVCILTLYYYR